MIENMKVNILKMRNEELGMRNYFSPATKVSYIALQNLRNE